MLRASLNPAVRGAPELKPHLTQRPADADALLATHPLREFGLEIGVQRTSLLVGGHPSRLENATTTVALAEPQMPASLCIFRPRSAECCPE